MERLSFQGFIKDQGSSVLICGTRVYAPLRLGGKNFSLNYLLLMESVYRNGLRRFSANGSMPYTCRCEAFVAEAISYLRGALNHEEIAAPPKSTPA